MSVVGLSASGHPWPAGARLLSRVDVGLDHPGALRAVVAIPVRNEAHRLERCLDALARQRHADGSRFASSSYAVLLLLNNCTDDSRAVALAAAGRLGLPLRLIEAGLAPPLAHAGWARRLAMDEAADLLGGRRDGLILSTDADSRVVPGWLAAAHAAIARGVDAVAGPIDGEPEEYQALNARCRRRCELQRRYGELLERLASLIDPEPHDPWPRHFFHCGASMAVRLPVYAAIGGLPPEPASEDNAFFARLARAGLRIRHCPDFAVLTSCRMQGRAQGGMADTLVRWSGQGAPNPAWDRIDSFAATMRRLRLRAGLRRAQAGLSKASLSTLARSLRLPRATLSEALALPTFGMAWESLNQLSPALRPSSLPARQLASQIERARSLVERLSGDGLAQGAADQIQPVVLAA